MVPMLVPMLVSYDLLMHSFRRIDGETRIGIFATRDIKRGEHLTYDYQYEHLHYYLFVSIH